MRFVSYLRVSTQKQGSTGLGIDAQRNAVSSYLAGVPASLLDAEYVEVESGKVDSRPMLAKALAHCRLVNGTLICAKVDRLARNAHFLLTVVKESGENGVVFCDMPNLPSGAIGKFMLTQLASVAELEAGLISQRTKAALAEAKKRGTKLGGFRGHVVDYATASAARSKAADAFASDVGQLVALERAKGLSLAAIAAAMQAKGVRTMRGANWNAMTVSNILKRVAA